MAGKKTRTVKLTSLKNGLRDGHPVVVDRARQAPGMPISVVFQF